ncbi:Tn5252, Orf 10 protein [Streptococcus pneumoniae]|uniref:SAG1252 family conjugative relaxosome accessory protein n=1 Tax=Streptococcus pneumoniae TaxID=1313 RepID=UPI001023F762|nr:SAG1252 family conjugative relaxosome accessory protein [Streptococcus pneumoniae]VFH48905.1 Tn5252, Orf 10 protein [Streptococcus pneumoniae]VMA63676.1 Tn5252, Orf 10 protein [Streptococcus pneumoniae]VMD73351.1 Tn5252, Orf 10 protein [Streptococcus pneumoniae]VPF27012.1 Tn5252, Orf 10 protein [Streptococcus pneumoniae]VPI33468.1 Tn5252, Orf 10 protein [Streptococcus pneumoniae]
MSGQYRDIRKEVNLTADELKQIEKMMEVDNYRHFSSFVRDKILMTDDKQLDAKEWFSLWQSQKFEQISRDVHLVLIIARENHQVTQEHVSILLTCVQELIAEVNQVQSLSRGFREKYMR